MTAEETLVSKWATSDIYSFGQGQLATIAHAAAENDIVKALAFHDEQYAWWDAGNRN
jgi:hypothetical protein